MSNDFNNALDNFLNERMGEAVFNLKEKNEKYRNALEERSELLDKAKNNKINDYQQTFNRLAELDDFIRDLECRFYFYTGLAMHKKIDDAVSSFASPESFTE